MSRTPGSSRIASAWQASMMTTRCKAPSRARFRYRATYGSTASGAISSSGARRSGRATGAARGRRAGGGNAGGRRPRAGGSGDHGEGERGEQQVEMAVEGVGVPRQEDRHRVLGPVLDPLADPDEGVIDLGLGHLAV